MNITEENFIVQMRSHDEDALKYMIQNYGWVIKSVIKKHLYQLPNYEEECINDVLLGVWENINYFDETRTSFANWLGGVARYKALNYVRKYVKELQRQSLEEVEGTTEDITSNLLIEKELEEQTQELLGCLKEEDKELFRRLYIEQEKVEWVSKYMGLKKAVIYNRISRGKKKIKKWFEKLEGSEKING